LVRVSDPMLFDRRAESYERARPPYPDELYARLAELGVLRADVSVLEIGAGSGQATELFVRAGAAVTAVEPGPALAARLAERLPVVRVVRSTFEEAVLPEAAFDSVISATAFHWLDLEVALPAIRNALAPNGILALWWNVFGDPAVSTPFRDTVAAVTARRDSPETGPPGPLATESWTASLTRKHLFAVTHTEQFRWSVDLTADRVRDLFGTFSGWSDDDVAEVASAAAALGGTVTEHYVTALFVCRPTTTG
jgi:SAM-dependent methyltransferase